MKNLINLFKAYKYHKKIGIGKNAKYYYTKEKYQNRIQKDSNKNYFDIKELNEKTKNIEPKSYNVELLISNLAHVEAHKEQVISNAKKELKFIKKYPQVKYRPAFEDYKNYKTAEEVRNKIMSAVTLNNDLSLGDVRIREVNGNESIEITIDNPTLKKKDPTKSKTIYKIRYNAERDSIRIDFRNLTQGDSVTNIGNPIGVVKNAVDALRGASAYFSYKLDGFKKFNIKLIEIESKQEYSNDMRRVNLYENIIKKVLKKNKFEIKSSNIMGKHIIFELEDKKIDYTKLKKAKNNMINFFKAKKTDYGIGKKRAVVTFKRKSKSGKISTVTRHQSVGRTKKQSSIKISKVPENEKPINQLSPKDI